MSRIAVIGGGVSGLAAAWLLSRHHDILLFEREDRLGGILRTALVDTPEGPLAFESGFLLHHDLGYPRLLRLIAALGLDRHPADASLGITDRSGTVEYGLRGPGAFLAAPASLLRAEHRARLGDVLRFNRVSRRLVERPTGREATDDESLDAFLRRHGLSHSFLESHLRPLLAAIWIATDAEIGSLPAAPLIRLLHGHGMTRLIDHPAWASFEGGSAALIAQLASSSRIAVHLRAAPTRVFRDEHGVRLAFADRPAVATDEVIFACPPVAILPMLDEADANERAVLGALRSRPAEAVLHTDASWLPQRRRARGTWNCRLDAPGGPAMTGWLNPWRPRAARRDYCVTVDARAAIDAPLVLGRRTFQRPVLTPAAIEAQGRWATISGRRHAHYCGAYWFAGSIEDGLQAAARVAATLGVRW